MMMNKLIFMLLLLSYTTCYSQIVNIENKRLLGEKDGFSGRFDANMNFSVNTKTLFQVGGKLNLAFTKKRHYLLLVGDQSLVKTNDESFVNNGFEHLRYNYLLKDSGKVTFEAYQQIQFNKIQQINLRLLLGTGFRFSLIDLAKYQLNIGVGLMQEYEELEIGVGTTDLLSANYVSFDGQFTDNIGLNTITYFQPKITNFGTFRLANETSIRLAVNKNLSVRFIYNLTHDNRDREGIRKTNYIFKTALSFTF
jgi:putative salt-induced outer membrane protein YdiY